MTGTKQMNDPVAIILGLVFLVALVSGAPLFTIIGGGAVLLFSLAAGESISAPITEMGRLASAPGIIAIPLFIFAGFIFAKSNASRRLIQVSDALLGWLPGGLAVVTVIVSTVFTAMTGGSGITIIACGGILFPALVANRYGEDFALGFVTSSASSGVLFIPSLPVIIYGMVARTDITQLFIASFVPAIVIMMVLTIYGIFFGTAKQVPTVPFSFARLGKSLWEIKWMIPLPVIVIGGIYTGKIAVGDAAAVSVIYALITECLIYREIGAKDLVEVAVDAMTTVGAILVVLGAALGFTNFLVDQQVPQVVMEAIVSHVDSRLVFLLLLNLFLLVVGCIMDIFSAIVVVVPLIVPVANEFGIDPFHLGVIFLANLTIGYITPPVGMNLFIASLRFNRPVLKLYKVVVPALILLLITLAVISYWPKMSLFLLDISGKRPPLLQF